MEKFEDKNAKNDEKMLKNRNFFHKLSNFINKYICPDNFKCIFCGADIADFSHKPYCSSCEKILPFNCGKCCKICAESINNEQEICDFCQREKRSFKKLFAPFRYEGIVKKSVLEFKHESKKYLAKGFAIILCEMIKDIRFDYITYIPKTDEKIYNHSKTLAEEISKLLNVPCVKMFSKVKATKPQKSLPAAERTENVKDAFLINFVATNKTILLVDDVATTCATLEACASKSKGNCVYAVVIARNNLPI